MATAPVSAKAPYSRISLRMKMAGLLVVVFVVFSVAYCIYTTNTLQASAESEMLEESRMLVTEMEAVWDFVSINQDSINHDADGSYNYRGIHCAIAGKSVAALFSQHSDYSMRFVNTNPRNANNAPDDYEAASLADFRSGNSASERYSVEDIDGEDYFRYVKEMVVTEACVDCHGGQAGEIDATGHEKEGLAIGDVAGAVSLKVPVALFYGNAAKSVQHNMAFFIVVMALVIAIVYVAFSRLIARPLLSLTESMERMEASPEEEIELPTPPPAPFLSREISELFAQFDSLTRSLSDVYDNLEQQVSDRTEQLTRANAELERQRAQTEAANAQLARDNQYKSDFLAIVSHELRTPLTSVIAFAELLADSVGDSNPDACQQIEEIRKNGAILLEMVDNVLQTARIQAGNEHVNLELVDMNDIIGMVESSNASVALKKGVEFTTCVNPDVPLIMSDWEKIRRIVVNLVSNAIKFTDSGGRVSVLVRALPEAGEVQISVADTGIGIPADKHELVFSRFTQENMSTVRRYGGSGLGLSLVKDLVAMLGGSVTLESEVGRGSTFSVRLPMESRAAGEGA